MFSQLFAPKFWMLITDCDDTLPIKQQYVSHSDWRNWNACCCHFVYFFMLNILTWNEKALWNVQWKCAGKLRKTSFPCASAVRPLAVSSAQISASVCAVWLPEASAHDCWAWSPQGGLGSLFSKKTLRGRNWSITAALICEDNVKLTSDLLFICCE